jgi:GT2 family glycosyltransferase
MKETESPISIVIPTFNRRYKLARLIHSILKSDYPKNKIELIVIDDASKDGTYEFVKEFIRSHKEISFRYIRHEKSYLVAKSRNEGIIAASHEYVFFIDDDNILDPGCLKTLSRVIERNNDIGVAGPVTYYLKNPKVIQYAGSIYSRFMRRTVFLYNNIKDDGTLLKGKLIDVDGIANSYMLRRSLAIRAGLIPWKRIPWNGEDGYLQYKIKKMGFRVVVVGDAKVFHDAPMPKGFTNMLKNSKYNEMRLYYALRSKIVFHRDLDNSWGFICLLFTLPGYIMFYTIIAVANNSVRNKLSGLKAIIDGIIDGARNEETLKYV